MILEMNAKENPKWMVEFEKILISKYNISKTDAIFILGDLAHCMRTYKE